MAVISIYSYMNDGFDVATLANSLSFQEGKADAESGKINGTMNCEGAPQVFSIRGYLRDTVG